VTQVSGCPIRCRQPARCLTPFLITAPALCVCKRLRWVCTPSFSGRLLVMHLCVCHEILPILESNDYTRSRNSRGASLAVLNAAMINPLCETYDGDARRHHCMHHCTRLTSKQVPDALRVHSARKSATRASKQALSLPAAFHVRLSKSSRYVHVADVQWLALVLQVML
jgi:hypothetical protein